MAGEDTAPVYVGINAKGVLVCVAAYPDPNARPGGWTKKHVAEIVAEWIADGLTVQTITMSKAREYLFETLPC